MRIEGLDFGSPEKENIPYAKREHITLLIGSGFSVPCGMPTGKQLNNKILNIDEEPITFSWEGLLAISTTGKRQRINSPYDKVFDFCCKCMKYYNSFIKPFDYEEFYDYIKSNEIYGECYRKLVAPSITNTMDFTQIIGNMDNVYTQIVDYVLAKERKTELKPEEHAEDKFSKYTKFIGWIEKESATKAIDIYTLNHDLLLENLSKGNWLTEKISDGFDEYRSRYYGEIEIEGIKYNCRLKEYTGRYNSPIRLYKLHGSIDYLLFKRHTSADSMTLVPDKFIKVPRSIGINHTKKQWKSKLGYDEDMIEYSPDFLSGTKTKQKYYNKFLYKKLFKKFKNDLLRTNKLVIIGYGGRDEGINKRILSYFDYNHKSSCILDPYYKSNKDISKLGSIMNSDFIEKSIEDFEME